MATHTDGVTTLPGREPVWNIAPGRAAALKGSLRALNASIVYLVQQIIVNPVGRSRSLSCASLHAWSIGSPPL